MLLALAFPAWASLGENVTSVQNDKVYLKGSMRSVSTERYVMHEIQTPAGNLVREFVSPGGSVFAIAWDGPTQPDLQQLMGAYFEQFRQASEQQQRRGPGPLMIETPNLVVQQSGHMRSFHGRAYLPQALPNGVQSGEIR
jgi:hypothetical protein